MTRLAGGGTVYQEKKTGRWVGAIDLGWGPDGKRNRKRVIGATEREAARRLRELQEKLEEHGSPDAADVARQTVAQYLEAWLREVVAGEANEKTRQIYAYQVRTHIVPGVGRVRLTELTAQHVQVLLNQRRAAGYSASTVSQTKRVLGTALEHARSWRLIRDNPAHLVRGPRIVHKRDRRILAPREALALLEVVRKDRLYSLFVVAMTTGIRQGESLGLLWSDVDLDAAIARIEHQLQRREGKLQLVTLKAGSRSRHTVALSAIAVEALRQQRQQQRIERIAAGPLWQDHGLVFTTSLGTPLIADNVRRSFKRWLTRAELPDMKWHELRHTVSSWLNAEGIPPADIRDALGHSGIAVTMDVYTHGLPEQQRRVADTIDRILNPPRERAQDV